MLIVNGLLCNRYTVIEKQQLIVLLKANHIRRYLQDVYNQVLVCLIGPGFVRLTVRINHNLRDVPEG